MANGILKAPYYIEVTGNTTLTALEGIVYHVKNTGTGLVTITYGSNSDVLYQGTSLCVSYINSSWCRNFSPKDYLASDLTVSVDTGWSGATFQTVIDSLAKVHKGKTLIFDFGGSSNSFTFASILDFSGFSSGVIYLQGTATGNRASITCRGMKFRNGTIANIKWVNCTFTDISVDEASNTRCVRVVDGARADFSEMNFISAETTVSNPDMIGVFNGGIAGVVSCDIRKGSSANLQNSIYAQNNGIVCINTITGSGTSSEQPSYVVTADVAGLVKYGNITAVGTVATINSAGTVV